jgi:hypothetical protein
VRYTITKEDEGNIIYAIPTGNNARRFKKDSKPIEFIVKKVKRKYVDLARIRDDGTEGIVAAFHPTTGATQQMINSGHGGNAGYLFFKTIDDISKHLLENEMRKDIYDFFKSRSFELDFDDIEAIYNIIDVKKRIQGEKTIRR